MIIGKKTPTSALSLSRNLAHSVRKIEHVSWKTPSTGLEQFLSKLRQRYCRMAPTKRSEVQNVGPAFSSSSLSSASDRVFPRMDAASGLSGNAFMDSLQSARKTR